VCEFEFDSSKQSIVFWREVLDLAFGNAFIFQDKAFINQVLAERFLLTLTNTLTQSLQPATLTRLPRPVIQ
jgi:hypothetical protein